MSFHDVRPDVRFSLSFLELQSRPWEGRLHSALLCVKQVDNGTNLAISRRYNKFCTTPRIHTAAASSRILGRRRVGASIGCLIKTPVLLRGRGHCDVSPFVWQHDGSGQMEELHMTQ